MVQYAVNSSGIFRDKAAFRGKRLLQRVAIRVIIVIRVLINTNKGNENMHLEQSDVHTTHQTGQGTSCLFLGFEDELPLEGLWVPAGGMWKLSEGTREQR